MKFIIADNVSVDGLVKVSAGNVLTSQLGDRVHDDAHKVQEGGDRVQGDGEKVHEYGDKVHNADKKQDAHTV